MGELAAELNAAPAAGLAPGDVLSVRFSRSPDWNLDGVLVGPDGRASFLALGELDVEGLDLAQLDDRLTAEYARILLHPDLTVSVTAVAPGNVFVMGEVEEGGMFELPVGALSLVEALALAGGFVRDTAQLDSVLLVRRSPARGRVQTWRVDARPARWDAEAPLLLRAHDVVFVPARAVVHVNDWIDRYIRRNIPIYLLPVL